MQTRRSSRGLESAASTTAAPSASLPFAVQALILDKLVAAYPVPDSAEYTLWPFRSSMAWLLSLRRVCRAWDLHLQQQGMLKRRMRLEQLRNLSLLHDFAYYITSSSRSKQQRVHKVPRSICLRFDDGSSTVLDVPKGGVCGAAKQSWQPNPLSGLPLHALLLVCRCDQVSSAALLQLLEDLDTLDRHHEAAMILQIRGTAAAAEPSSGDGCRSGVDAVGGGGDMMATACSLSALQAAVAPALTRGVLRDIAQEGDPSCGALTFIPTRHGFCRRLPLPVV